MLKRRWIPVVIVSVPVVIALATALHIDLPLQYVFRVVIHPIQGWLFESSEQVDTAANTALIDPEYVRALEEENTQLKIEQAQLRSFVQETGLLEEQLQFLAIRDIRSVQARIISRSVERQDSIFVLNVGSQDEIKPGLAVMTGSGVCVGIIDAVRDTTSTMRLLSDSSTQLSSVIQNKEASQGVVSGSHQLSLRMSFIPDSDTIFKGNTVVTSGIDPLIPPGLVIGTVSAIEKKENALFQEAVIQPLFNEASLSIVSVVLP